MDQWYSRGFLAGVGLSVLCASAARCAEAPHETPHLRMPDPLWSLRDMYPDIAGRTAAAAPQVGTRAAQPHAEDVEREFAAGRTELPLTNAWQRLAEARTPGGVRILTLWRATAGTIALHAGRHGGPSLQWTSPTSAHGTSPRGLLDHLATSGGQSNR
jgi:hypothetical protein